MSGHQGLYVLRNRTDINPNRFNVGMAKKDLTTRINTYYMYMPDGIDIMWACTLKDMSIPRFLYYEKKLSEFILEASGGAGNVEFFFPDGRHTGTE